MLFRYWLNKKNQYVHKFKRKLINQKWVSSILKIMFILRLNNKKLEELLDMQILNLNNITLWSQLYLNKMMEVNSLDLINLLFIKIMILELMLKLEELFKLSKPQTEWVFLRLVQFHNLINWVLMLIMRLWKNMLMIKVEM